MGTNYYTRLTEEVLEAIETHSEARFTNNIIPTYYLYRVVTKTWLYLRDSFGLSFYKNHEHHVEVSNEVFVEKCVEAYPLYPPKITLTDKVSSFTCTVSQDEKYITVEAPVYNTFEEMKKWEPTLEEIREYCGVWVDAFGEAFKVTVNILKVYDSKEEFVKLVPGLDCQKIEDMPEQCLPKPEKERYHVKWPLLAGVTNG